jgi:hypothetical protein
MRHSRSRMLVVATMCACGASSMAHAGPPLSAPAQALAINTPPTPSARPLTLTPTTLPAPAMSVHPQPLALDAPRLGLVGRETVAHLAPTEREGVVAFPIQWQKRTELERIARNFRHNGLPLVRLWGSGRNLLAIGLSPHRVPGIYFTQNVPD